MTSDTADHVDVMTMTAPPTKGPLPAAEHPVRPQTYQCGAARDLADRMFVLEHHFDLLLEFVDGDSLEEYLEGLDGFTKALFEGPCCTEKVCDVVHRYEVPPGRPDCGQAIDSGQASKRPPRDEAGSAGDHTVAAR